MRRFARRLAPRDPPRAIAIVAAPVIVQIWGSAIRARFADLSTGDPLVDFLGGSAVLAVCGAVGIAAVWLSYNAGAVVAGRLRGAGST